MKKEKLKSEHELILWINVLEVIFALGIVILAGVFSNWWLLFLLLLLGTANTERRILGLPEEHS